MQKVRTWVVKLGGAMMHAAELRPWLAACAGQGSTVRCVVVAGGGGFADGVRELDRRWNLPATLSHELAIAGMGLNAAVLAALAPGATLFSNLAAVPAGQAAAIWQPDQNSSASLGLPASWDVSADSIALRVAERVDAERLVLVKSLPPSQMAGRSLAQLARDGVIDPALPSLSSGIAIDVHLTSRAQHAAFARASIAGDVPPGISPA